MNSQMDPQAINLAKAIRQTESGGDFNAKGASGESGAYQWMPDTWKAHAGTVLGNPNAEMSPSNQNAVAYATIKGWKDKGLNPAQIAAKWNSGSEVGWENKRGVNSAGVAYDVPKYVASVTGAYQKVKAGSGVGVDPNNPSSTGYQPPVPPEPEKEPFSFSKMAKEIVSPVATMIARPFQAVQSGAQLVRSNREQPELEANAKKYGDEAYKLSLQLRDLPEGPEKQALVNKVKQAQNLSQYYTERLGNNASYQPFSTETLIKPFDSVKQDIGRGIQTVAFGMGPISGGAAFGTGMSLEEGNDLLSWDTAAYTAGGLVLGKAADIVGKPLLNAAGNVVGTITPTILKDVAAGGAKAMQAFMERNKILPNAVSKPINKGAELLEVGANAPFKAAAAPFRQNDTKVIAAREQALKDLEEKYAQLRESAARNPAETAATRARIARSNILTEDNMINSDGVIIGAKDAAKTYIRENVGQGESLVKQLLQKEGVSVDISVVERELNKVMKEAFNGRELISALNAVKREMAGLRLANRGGRIKLTDVHDAKVARQPGSKAYDNSETKAVDKQIARAHKQVVEKNSQEQVKAINAEIGKFLSDAEYIASLNGKRIASGKLGKAVQRVGGSVAGAVAGGAIGGLPGVAIGSYVGGAVSEKLAGRALRKAFGKPTSQTPAKSAIFESGRARLTAKQLALPPGPKLGTSGNPIITPIRDKGTGPVSVRAEKGEPVRNPKTGKFERTYLSGEKGLTPDQIVDIKKNKPLASDQMAQLISTKAREAADGKIFGFTSNLDGTEYVGKDAISTLQSKTLTREEASPENIQKLLKQTADLYGNNKFVKVGVFKMESGTGVSLDINVVTPNREVARRIARLNNQESYWDAAAEKVVPTGGTGEQKFTKEQIKNVLNKIDQFNVNNPEIDALSREYMRKAGVRVPRKSTVTFGHDEDQAMKIADAYTAMKDQPNNLRVRKAYKALAKETYDQYKVIEKAGYKIEPWKGKGEPYKNSEEMVEDVLKNKHLYFFTTENGFGSGTALKNHPLLQKTGIKINDYELVYNDLFRAVHDIFGHAKIGNKFSAFGEENAWRTHSQMYSDDARRALTSETRGQNSWVNYGPQMRNADGKLLRPGDKGYLKAPDREFAEQKTGLLPDEFVFNDISGIGKVKPLSKPKSSGPKPPEPKAQPVKTEQVNESSTNNSKLNLRNNPQAGFIDFGAIFGGSKKTMKASQLVSHEGAPDKLRVKFWKNKIKNGDKVKPVLVIKEGNKYGIEDGKHRFQAFKELGITNIPVQIVG